MAITQGATDTWTKSSYSGGNGAMRRGQVPCRRLRRGPRLKVPAGPSITFVADAWNAFVREVGTESL